MIIILHWFWPRITSQAHNGSVYVYIIYIYIYIYWDILASFYTMAGGKEVSSTAKNCRSWPTFFQVVIKQIMSVFPLKVFWRGNMIVRGWEERKVIDLWRYIFICLFCAPILKVTTWYKYGTNNLPWDVSQSAPHQTQTSLLSFLLSVHPSHPLSVYWGKQTLHLNTVINTVYLSVTVQSFTTTLQPKCIWLILI